MKVFVVEQPPLHATAFACAT